MNVSFSNAQYPVQNRNTSFQARTYFVHTYKLKKILKTLPDYNRDRLLDAIDMLKSYFTDCLIYKEINPVNVFGRKIRKFVLRMPDGRTENLLSIDHKWNANDIIRMASKLEALSVNYPEYNQHLARHQNKEKMRWSFNRIS